MQKLEYLRISRSLKDHADRFQRKLARWNEFRENHTLRKECLAHAQRYLNVVQTKLGHLKHQPQQEVGDEVRRCQSLRASIEAQIIQLRAFDQA